MLWVIGAVVALLLVGLFAWASRGRGTSEAERSSDWVRGPSDGGGLGGF